MLIEPTAHRRFVATGEFREGRCSHGSYPVVPGAPIDPGLFAVHRGRIYAFATEDCIREFSADPTRFVTP